MAKLIYEKQTCTRCGGSGHYSYCERFGTVCFKCAGTGRMASRAGVKAAAAVKQFMADNFSILVEDLKPGDRFRDDTFGTVEVKAIQTAGGSRFGAGTDPATGETIWRDYVNIDLARSARSSIGPVGSIGKIPGTTVVRAVRGEEWARVVEFARTLKRGVTVVEEVAA